MLSCTDGKELSVNVSLNSQQTYFHLKQKKLNECFPMI